MGDSYRAVVSGETVFASRGLAHGFSNHGSEETRYLVALTPLGYEFDFERLAALIRGLGRPKPIPLPNHTVTLD